MNRLLHILIAEDDEDDSEIIADCFRTNPNFSRIDLVRNGQELLDYLNVPEKPYPDAILMDINMPLMDGIQAIRQMSENQLLHHIPIFIYTTSINPAHQVACIDLGVRAFLIKPISLDEFESIPKQIVAALLD